MNDKLTLSATNPAATTDQRELEGLALQVLQMPEMIKARAAAIARWKSVIGRDATPEGWSCFDRFIDEAVFNYALKGVNSDANYPKVLGHIYGPPHEWFGMKVPGSRSGLVDNPDNHYNVIPIDGYARYELTGHCLKPEPIHGNLSVSGNFSLAMTQSTLDWPDVHVNPDGSFVITVGPEPANGRSNHLQTRIEARFLFIRDTRSDWAQVPRSYRIRRLDPPAAPPLTLEQMADRTAHFLIYDIPQIYLLMRIIAGIEVNSCLPPINTDTAVGGLITQMISFGRVKLADAEAFVVTTGSGGAPYHSLGLSDYWLDTLDYGNHINSLNNAQTFPNADGSTTYVISSRDPGVHNWLDTTGLHELALTHRWQDLPRTPGGYGKPSIKGELVKLNELDRVLPRGMKRVTPAERQQQLAERLEKFQLRYVDH